MKILIINIICLFLIIQLRAQIEINVKTFGAKGDGRTDDTKSIQAAIDKASPLSVATIYFPAGIYNIASYHRTDKYLRNYCILLHSNLHLEGDGEKSIIKVGDHLFDKPDTSANAHIFYGKQLQNVGFYGLMIDMNGKNNLVPLGKLKNNAAIFADGGENFSIRNIIIKNCSGRNMLNIETPGDNLHVEDCSFFNGGHYVGSDVSNKNQTDFSFIYSEWSHTVIKNNVIEQQNIDIALENYTGGIEIHGDNSSVENNKITGCWPGMYLTSILSPLENVTVKNNTFSKCFSGVTFYVNYPVKNVFIENNKINLTPARNSKKDLCAGIRVPNGNVTEYNKEMANMAPIYNLKITQNTITADSMETFSMGMLLHSLHNCIISENTISQMNYGGIVLQGSKWGTDSVSIENNKFSNFKKNNNSTAVAGYVIVTDTYSPKTNDAPGFNNVSVNDNQFIDSKDNIQRLQSINAGSSKTSKTNFHSVFVALPEGAIDEIKFKNNNFGSSEADIFKVKIK